MNLITLYIAIKEIEPPIWRRISISGNANLLDLHHVIQHAFGWTNTHLFIFKLGEMNFVHYPDWEADAYRYQSAELAILEDLIPDQLSEGSTFSYVYDLGDNWEHEIYVESVSLAPMRFSGASCVEGARAAPPENVGSIPGYFNLLKTLQTPGSSDYRELMNWMGYTYDPEYFDRETVNCIISDYFVVAQLRKDSIWCYDIPFFNLASVFFGNWTDSPEHLKYANDITLRRDVITLMTYLIENKVTGTKASGNFPLKDVRGIAEGFVDPPVLDEKIGDKLYKLRSEDEVPDMLFIHHFSNLAGLIIGGENQQWQVTHYGKSFLQATPLEQVWFLTNFWFLGFHWDNCLPYEDNILGSNAYTFQQLLLSTLVNYPVGETVSINQLFDAMELRLPGWERKFGFGGRFSNHKMHYFEKIVLEPFYKLGLFEILTKESDILPGFFDITDITITDFGKTLMQYFIRPSLFTRD